MQIDKRITGRVTRLYLEGDIDLVDADLIRGIGSDALDHQCSTLRIDLSGVTFMGASGVAALVAIRNEALCSHVLVLENVSPPVRRILRTSGLDAVFTIQ